ncbi:unnamed protein product, partial [Amoebophrya sp. A25]|eukprot:GSA25T00024552001.1
MFGVPLLHVKQPPQDFDLGVVRTQGHETRVDEGHVGESEVDLLSSSVPSSTSPSSGASSDLEIFMSSDEDEDEILPPDVDKDYNRDGLERQAWQEDDPWRTRRPPPPAASGPLRAPSPPSWRFSGRNFK